MPKLCEFETCRNRATYGTNSSPIRCITHKEINMKKASSLCNCGKQPLFNFIGLIAKFCFNCKTEGMIDVKTIKCICGKQPHYNFKDLKPKFCSNCKTDGMIDVKNIKCFCGKSQPRFNFEGQKAKFCNDCKEENMINLLSKKCKCGKRARFNFEGLLVEYCYNCKKNGMVDLEKKRCKCKNKFIANFNFQGLKPEYCSECKKDGMIDVVHEKCSCGKARPTFNLEGLKPNFCLQCKTNEMINVIDDRCKQNNCYVKGNKSYKGYCTTCFQHLFPLDPLTFQIRSKTKEIAVRDFINSKFEDFYHDKSLWYNEAVCDCTTKRRIDHRKLINGTLLCIETDENQHKTYSKSDEEARYHDLFMAYGGKFIFIRFNPDKYKDEKGKSCNPMLFNRLIVLENEINKQINRIENDENTDLLEVVELYYDKSI